MGSLISYCKSHDVNYVYHSYDIDEIKKDGETLDDINDKLEYITNKYRHMYR